MAPIIDVAIVGGGLSGLTAAYVARKAGASIVVLEAGDRLGGRIDSIRHPQSDTYMGDLGPTWVWPPYQPTVSRWLDTLGASLYNQYDDGDGILDFGEADGPRRMPLPGQHGIKRIVGGPQALIDGLAAIIPTTDVKLAHAVKDVRDEDDCFLISTNQQSFHAKTLVLAAPLRTMAQSIDWNGIISKPVAGAMQEVPTWMAAQAKIVMVFDHAFWRDRGLSGRVASRIGPLVEIHDHVSADGNVAALFGFVGLGVSERKAIDLEAAIKEQLQRCFGKDADLLKRIEVRDWADHTYICSMRDREGAAEHPTRLPSVFQEPHSDGRVFFGVAETAVASPGLIDGALEAGERAANQALTALNQRT